MTPQILLDALRGGFLKLEMVRLLVIDECHRTTGNHPYAMIMKEFYHKSTDKPRMFGLTTTDAIREGMMLFKSFSIYVTVLLMFLLIELCRSSIRTGEPHGLAGTLFIYLC